MAHAVWERPPAVKVMKHIAWRGSVSVGNRSEAGQRPALCPGPARPGDFAARRAPQNGRLGKRRHSPRGVRRYSGACRTNYDVELALQRGMAATSLVLALVLALAKSRHCRRIKAFIKLIRIYFVGFKLIYDISDAYYSIDLVGAEHNGMSAMRSQHYLHAVIQ